MPQMHLWWVAVEVQILDADLDELADPRTGQEQRLDHQPLPAARSVGGLDQALDFEAIEAIHTAPAPSGRRQVELTPHVLDDVLGLVIAEPMLAPQARRVADDRGEAAIRLRLCCLTTHSGSIWRARHAGTCPRLRPEVRSRRSLRNSKSAAGESNRNKFREHIHNGAAGEPEPETDAAVGEGRAGEVF